VEPSLEFMSLFPCQEGRESGTLGGEKDGHMNKEKLYVTVTLFFSHSTLLFHSTMFPYHFTSFSPCCLLMLPLSLTRLNSFSHEPSFLVLLPLVCAHFCYLFKNVVTAYISLT